MIKKRQVREVVLDLETTGFAYTGRDRIIEIGVVELIDYDLTGNEFRRLVKPGRNEISPRITKLTGISNEDVAYEKMFKHPSVVAELIEFIGDSQIVAHNARFDRNFLNAELNRAGEKEFPKDRWIDTLRLAKETSPDLSSYKLDALCDQFRISRESRKSNHGALIDARLTARVYQRLLCAPGVTKQKGKEKKPKILINPELNFVEKSTKKEVREFSGTWWWDDEWRVNLEKHLFDATGLECRLNNIIPNPFSASSHYFPLAVLITAVFKLAWHQTGSLGIDEEAVGYQLEKDTKNFHRLIDLAGTNIELYFREMHKFHVEYNSRDIKEEDFYRPFLKYRPTTNRSHSPIFRQPAVASESNDFEEFVEFEIIEEDDDQKNIYEPKSIPNYYNYGKYATLSSSQPNCKTKTRTIDSIHQDLVNKLYLTTGHVCGLDWLLPNPHSASSPFFPVAVLTTGILKIAKARVIAGLEGAGNIESQLEEDCQEICNLIELACTDIKRYFKEMHEFHVDYNQRGYPDLAEY